MPELSWEGTYLRETNFKRERLQVEGAVKAGGQERETVRGATGSFCL